MATPTRLVEDLGNFREVEHGRLALGRLAPQLLAHVPPRLEPRGSVSVARSGIALVCCKRPPPASTSAAAHDSASIAVTAWIEPLLPHSVIPGVDRASATHPW
jgi:hypothetical protein